MGNYEQLKQSVSDVIKTNGNQEITGSILQNVLLTIISTVGANATFAGIATPATNPGTPDGPVFWLASESGAYSNFGGVELQDGLSVLVWNGSSWSSQQILGIDDGPTAESDNLVKSGGVFTAFDSLLGYITTTPNNYINYNSTTKILTIPRESYIKTYNESISLGNSDITIDLSTLGTDWVTIVYHKSTSNFGIYNRGYVVNPSNDIVVGQKVSASKYGLVLNAIYKVDGTFITDLLQNLDNQIENINDNVLGFNESGSLNILEVGGMTINSDGTYFKYSGQYTSRLRLKNSAIYLNSKSTIVGEEGCMLYVGGMYSDGTPIPNSWKFTNGGTYTCPKDGMYAIILKYAGSNEIEFDGETYTPEDLASHIQITNTSIVTKQLDNIPTKNSNNSVKSGGVFTAFDSILGYITTMPNVFINYNSITKVLTIPEASYIKTYNESISLGNSEITIDLSTLGTDWVTIVYHKSTSSFGIYNRGYIVNPYNDIVVGQKVSASKYGLLLNAIYKVDGIFPFDNTVINNIKFAKQNAIRNIAHQGYSTTSQYYGNSRLSSFIAAAKAGFDYGECDLEFSSDNIAVCCHDASFVDSVSGETIIIAEHTLAELETYNYYGETIASFDDVVKVCKQYGIGLYIDHVGNVNTAEKKNKVLSSLKKYRMMGNVRWLTSPASWILEFDAKAKFSIIYSPTGNDYVNDIISTLSSLHNTYPDNDITLDIIYTSLTTSDIITINDNIPVGTGIELWTIDSQSTFEEYIPYVLGITSNKVNETIIKNLG